MNLHLLDRVLAQPWAIRQENLTLLTQLIIGSKAQKFDQGATAIATAAPMPRPMAGYVPLGFEAYRAMTSLPAPPPGFTVIMIWGLLGRGWTAEEQYYLDAIEVDAILRAIAETPEGGTVVLWFRSPGGIITGIPETAAAIRAASESRHFVAFSDDLCASAAYWLAGQCASIHATPTANVGSIGVYLAFYDWTEYLKMLGIKLELFKAGRLKGMGLPGNPLSSEEAAYLQAGVDEGYKMFTADVLRNRALEEETMQGQTFRGAAAVKANLIDGLHPSFASYLTAAGKETR